MSHDVGAYLGGIRSIAHLRERCRIDDTTGCWHWGLSIVQGSPKVHWVDVDGKKRVGRGRRAALEIAGRLKAGQTAFAADQCKSADCVNPDHCRAGTRAAAGAALSRSGKWKGHPTKLLAAKAASDAKKKLSDEQRAEIRARTEPQRDLAAEYDVSQYAIWAIKRGRKIDGMSVFNPGAWT